MDGGHTGGEDVGRVDRRRGARGQGGRGRVGVRGDETPEFGVRIWIGRPVEIKYKVIRAEGGQDVIQRAMKEQGSG